MTYGEVEAALAEMHRIPDEKRVAFKARLKHFQRLGFPKGANTGTGKRVAYTLGMTLHLAVATDLVQLGNTPERIANKIIGEDSSTFARGFSRAFTEISESGDDLYYLFSTSTITIGDVTHDRLRSITCRISEISPEAESGAFLNAVTRAGMVNLSKILQQIIDYIQREKVATIDQISADMHEWAEAFQAEDADMIAFMDRANHVLNKKA